MEFKKAIADHRGKAGAVGGGSIGVAGVIFIFNQMMADIPKQVDLSKMELRITEKIGLVEKAMNDSALAYIEQLVATRTALDNHISTDQAAYNTLAMDFKAHEKIKAHPEANAQIKMILRKIER